MRSKSIAHSKCKFWSPLDLVDSNVDSDHDSGSGALTLRNDCLIDYYTDVTHTHTHYPPTRVDLFYTHSEHWWFIPRKVHSFLYILMFLIYFATVFGLILDNRLCVLSNSPHTLMETRATFDQNRAFVFLLGKCTVIDVRTHLQMALTNQLSITLFILR